MLTFEQVVGKFDVNFFPAFKEDQDYSYRLTLTDIIRTHVLVVTVHGAADVLSYVSGTHSSADREAAKETRGRNRYREMMGRADTERYYGQKWGGPVHQEVHKTPFGLGGPLGAWAADNKRIACIRGDSEGGAAPGGGGQCGPYDVSLMKAAG